MRKSKTVPGKRTPRRPVPSASKARAEDGVQDLQRQFVEAIEHLPVGLVLCDAEDRIVLTNTLFRQMYYSGLEDVLAPGKCYRAALRALVEHRGRDKDWLEERWARHKNPGEPFKQILRDGRVLQVLETRTSDGGTIGVHVDVTDLSTKTDALTAKTSQFQALLEAIDQGIAMWDGDLNCLAFNRRFLELNWLPDDLAAIGAPFEAMIRFSAEKGYFGEGDVEEIVAKRVEQARQFRPHTFSRKGSDGRIIEVRGYPLDGGGFVSTYTDITERTRSRNALTRTSDQLRTILETIDQGIAMWDADLKCRAFNHMFLELNGLPDDFGGVGTPLEAFVRYSAERGILGEGDVDDIVAARLAQVREPEPHAFTRTGQDGRLIEVRGYPLESGGLVTTYLDVTERTRRKEAFKQKSAELQAVLDAIDQGITMWDGNLVCRAINARFHELLGIPPELAHVGAPFADLVRAVSKRDMPDGPELDALIEERVALARKFEPNRVERVYPDGTAVEVDWHPMGGGGGGFVSTYKDITERRNAEQEIKRRDEELTDQVTRFELALTHMSQGLCMFDAEDRLVVCNDRYAKLYRLPPELTQPGTPISAIVEHRIETGQYPGDDPDAYRAERVEASRKPGPTTQIYHMNDGRVIAVQNRPAPGGIGVATHEDITELQQAQAKVAYMAHHDVLTDLPNRVLLRDCISEAMPLARRGRNFAVLCLDLDRFKPVNDALGHAIGDELLRAVADRLKECVRETDTVARLGGDEFAIVQVSGDQPRDATALANRVCEIVRQPFDLLGHRVIIDVSVGIAIAPGDGGDADQLLKNADMALYGAKNEGRGTYRFFEPEMDARMKERRQLELDLRVALEHGQFEVFYQPLFKLETREVCGLEALLRWHHPKRGLISPTDFIALTEEIGLIIPLGEWVIREACRAARNWPEEITVAVNLSPVQFKSGNLIGVVVNALAASGIPAGRLELEITESVLLQSSEDTLKTLHGLRELGVRIAMDDFGTGYSSLSYLRSFPFDKIKIDGSFVTDLTSGEDGVAIIRAVASLGASLGMATTAEGVETEEQFARVSAEGYTEIQGFLFSPPRPADEITDLYFPPEKAVVTVGKSAG